MFRHESQSFAIVVCAFIFTLLSSGGPVMAQTYHFRLTFENVPGVDDIESGDLDAGIKQLESRLVESEGADAGAILATLCAAYILDDSLWKARDVCDRAVETSPTEIALNNRGVYRIHSGDYLGAREDFARVRPVDMESYLDKLRTTDVPLVAEDNFNLVEQMLSGRLQAEGSEQAASRGARIEGFID